MSSSDDDWLRPSRPLPPSPATSPTRAPSIGYEAFGRQHDRPALIEFRQRPMRGMTEQGEIFPLAYLLRVTYTGNGATDLVTFTWGDLLVRVSGRNLTGLRQAVMAGQVDFVQEHDDERWPAPLGKDTPLVSGIVLQVRGKPKGQEQPA